MALWLPLPSSLLKLPNDRDDDDDDDDDDDGDESANDNEDNEIISDFQLVPHVKCVRTAQELNWNERN